MICTGSWDGMTMFILGYFHYKLTNKCLLKTISLLGHFEHAKACLTKPSQESSLNFFFSSKNIQKCYLYWITTPKENFQTCHFYQKPMTKLYKKT